MGPVERTYIWWFLLQLNGIFPYFSYGSMTIYTAILVFFLTWPVAFSYVSLPSLLVQTHTNSAATKNSGRALQETFHPCCCWMINSPFGVIEMIWCTWSWTPPNKNMSKYLDLINKTTIWENMCFTFTKHRTCKSKKRKQPFGSVQVVLVGEHDRITYCHEQLHWHQWRVPFGVPLGVK